MARALGAASLCLRSAADPCLVLPADKVVLMADGGVVAQGTHAELLAAGIDFHAALQDDDAACTPLFTQPYQLRVLIQATVSCHGLLALALG